MLKLFRINLILIINSYKHIKKSWNSILNKMHNSSIITHTQSPVFLVSSSYPLSHPILYLFPSYPLPTSSTPNCWKNHDYSSFLRHFPQIIIILPFFRQFSKTFIFLQYSDQPRHQTSSFLQEHYYHFTVFHFFEFFILFFSLLDVLISNPLFFSVHCSQPQL